MLPNPSDHGADYGSITYEHGGHNVVHYKRGFAQRENRIALVYYGWCGLSRAPIGVQKSVAQQFLHVKLAYPMATAFAQGCNKAEIINQRLGQHVEHFSGVACPRG